MDIREYYKECQGFKLENRNYNKRCPKCKGNLLDIDDFYGPYQQCLQCGFIKYPKIIDKHVPEEELVSS